MAAGKCPKCENYVAEAIAERIGVKAADVTVAGISYLCPECFAVLGVQIDPRIALDELESRLSARIDRFQKKG